MSGLQQGSTGKHAPKVPQVKKAGKHAAQKADVRPYAADGILAGTKAAPENLGDVLVLGLGVSGKAVARYCAGLIGTRVKSLFIAAGARNDDSEAFVKSLVAPGVEWAFGDDALAGCKRRFDVCIASPGIPFFHELYEGAESVSDEVISEVEFSWRESAADSLWVAITGTNGKTTTTSCAAHVLKEAGVAANAVGNIGDVCLEAVVAGKTKVYVCEVSSYQLYSTRLFAPDVAILLNITPDHLHWHKTLEAYRDAKFKLLDNLSARALSTASDEGEGHAGRYAGSASRRTSRRAVAIMDATNDVVRAKVREVKKVPEAERGFAYVPLGTKEGLAGDMRAACGADNAAFIDANGKLHVAFDGVEHDIGNTGYLQIKGMHNVSNALAAGAVAVVIGVPDEKIAHALMSFAPLEHRIEPCGDVDGVACYNDSKATNVDATIKALAAFPNKQVTVMLGGDDKDTDLADLVKAAHEHAARVVLFGAGRPRFAEAFAQAADEAPEGFEVLEAQHMEDAFDAALGAAADGEIVLLSPACASFDEFTSFEHRGRVFKELVAQRAAAANPEAESADGEDAEGGDADERVPFGQWRSWRAPTRSGPEEV